MYLNASLVCLIVRSTTENRHKHDKCWRDLLWNAEAERKLLPWPQISLNRHNFKIGLLENWSSRSHKPAEAVRLKVLAQITDASGSPTSCPVLIKSRNFWRSTSFPISKRSHLLTLATQIQYGHAQRDEDASRHFGCLIRPTVWHLWPLVPRWTFKVT